MLVMPLRASEETKAAELSSTFQPVMFTGLSLTLVTSNQSAATGLLPLDHGATSVMTSAGGPEISTSWSVTVRV